VGPFTWNARNYIERPESIGHTLMAHIKIGAQSFLLDQYFAYACIRFRRRGFSNFHSGYPLRKFINLVSDHKG